MTSSRRTQVVGALALAAVGFAGCGGGEDFPNDARPAVPLQIGAVINKSEVSVQPARFGAGPIVLLISNQTDDSHSVTLEGKGISPSEVGPINPQDTATIQKDLPEGDFELTVASKNELGNGIGAAEITVASRRPSGSDTLLLP